MATRIHFGPYSELQPSRELVSNAGAPREVNLVLDHYVYPLATSNLNASCCGPGMLVTGEQETSWWGFERCSFIDVPEDGTVEYRWGHEPPSVTRTVRVFPSH